MHLQQEMGRLSFKAKNFAERIHREQVRKYSGEPYAVHLREVAGLCAEVGCRDEVIAAAWLHDAKEDQGVVDAELRELFGADVARLVDEVTDQSRPEDGNRETRKAIDRARELLDAEYKQVDSMIDVILAMGEELAEARWKEWKK